MRLVKVAVFIAFAVMVVHAAGCRYENNRTTPEIHASDFR